MDRFDVTTALGRTAYRAAIVSARLAAELREHGDPESACAADRAMYGYAKEVADAEALTAEQHARLVTHLDGFYYAVVDDHMRHGGIGVVCTRCADLRKSDTAADRPAVVTF